MCVEVALVARATLDTPRCWQTPATAPPPSAVPCSVAGTLEAVAKSLVVRDSRGGTSVPATALNICNIYIGIALLSMHYAVHRGGWLSLGALVAASATFCFSAHLIVRAFDLLPSHKPRTYPELGKAAYGNTGVRLVLAAAFLELAGTVIMQLLILWQLIQVFLPAHGLLGLGCLHTSVVLTTVALVPALLVPLRKLQWLSGVGSTASLAVVAVIISLLFVDPHREGTHQVCVGGGGGGQAVGHMGGGWVGLSWMPTEWRLRWAQCIATPLGHDRGGHRTAGPEQHAPWRSAAP